MKEPINFSPLKPNITLTNEEKHKLASFFNLLIEINKRAENNKEKSSKRKYKDGIVMMLVLFLFLTLLLSLLTKAFIFKLFKIIS